MPNIPHLTYKNCDPFSRAIASYVRYGSKRKFLPVVDYPLEWGFSAITNVYILYSHQHAGIICVIPARTIHNFSPAALERKVEQALLVRKLSWTRSAKL